MMEDLCFNVKGFSLMCLKITSSASDTMAKCVHYVVVSEIKELICDFDS